MWYFRSSIAAADANTSQTETLTPTGNPEPDKQNVWMKTQHISSWTTVSGENIEWMLWIDRLYSIL